VGIVEPFFRLIRKQAEWFVVIPSKFLARSARRQIFNHRFGKILTNTNVRYHITRNPVGSTLAVRVRSTYIVLSCTDEAAPSARQAAAPRGVAVGGTSATPRGGETRRRRDEAAATRAEAAAT
jgi:hypothetical protein